MCAHKLLQLHCACMTWTTHFLHIVVVNCVCFYFEHCKTHTHTEWIQSVVSTAFCKMAYLVLGFDVRVKGRGCHTIEVPVLNPCPNPVFSYNRQWQLHYAAKKIFLCDDLLQIRVFNSTFAADSRCNLFFLSNMSDFFYKFIIYFWVFTTFMYCFYDFYDSTTEENILISNISYKPVRMTMY